VDFLQEKIVDGRKRGNEPNKGWISALDIGKGKEKKGDSFSTS